MSLNRGASALSVKEIELAITQLPAKELAQLIAGLREYHAQVWDKQIEDDLEAGRLDRVLGEVENAHDPRSACPQ